MGQEDVLEPDPSIPEAQLEVLTAVGCTHRGGHPVHQAAAAAAKHDMVIRDPSAPPSEEEGITPLNAADLEERTTEAAMGHFVARQRLRGGLRRRLRGSSRLLLRERHARG